MASLRLTKNKDGTITVQVGSYREYVSTESKGPVELLDSVRWAAITGGASPDEAHLWELIRELNVDSD